MNQTFHPFGWKQKSEVCPWDKGERMMSDHKGSNAQWIEREYFRSDRWARDPITLTFLHIKKNYTSSSFNFDTHKVSDPSLCWIIGFDLQSDLASSQTIAMMLRSLFVICPKPHDHKNCYKSNRTIFFKVESPIFHLGDTQAWYKSWCKFSLIHRPGANDCKRSKFATNLIFWFWRFLSP